MRWTITQVADALGTRPGTGLNPLARLAGVSIDSRAIRAGELFIAIHGPRHDGHAHVAGALEGGAIAAVVAEAQLPRYADPVRGRCIAVEDTFLALKQLARAVRESWGGEIAGTDVGLVTRVSPEHLEFFASVDEIALAKRELIEGLNGRESTAVLNADDPRVAAFGAFAPGRVLTYGIENTAFFMARDIEDRGALGTAFDYVRPEGRVRFELNVPGPHAIANALSALAAASVWDIGAAEAQDVFRSLRAPAMRGELLRFSNGAALINDSYNSSPAALQAMTELLAATPNFRRRILAAGEMRELGTASPELHRAAGQFAAKTAKIDWVIGVSGDAAQVVEGAVGAGLPRERAKFFARPQEAAGFLADFIA